MCSLCMKEENVHFVTSHMPTPTASLEDQILAGSTIGPNLLASQWSNWLGPSSALSIYCLQTALLIWHPELNVVSAGPGLSGTWNQICYCAEKAHEKTEQHRTMSPDDLLNNMHSVWETAKGQVYPRRWAVFPDNNDNWIQRSYKDLKRKESWWQNK